MLVCLIQLSFSAGNNWYKYLKGKIRTSPVTMYLVKYGDRIRGYYHYDKYMQPIIIMGDVKGDSMSLSAYISGSESDECMEGIFRNDVYKGIWNLGNEKPLNVEAETDKLLTDAYEYIYVNGEQTLFNGWKDSPRTIYTAALVWPSDKNQNSAFIRKCILEYRKYPAGLISIDNQMLAGKKKYLSAYKKEFNDVSKKDAEEYPSMYTMEEEDILSPVFSNKNIAVFAWTYYSYTGGAHGNYGTGYLMLDLAHNKKLMLSDVLKDDGITALNSSILEKNFRKQFNVDDTLTLTEFGVFSDTLSVTDNFFITPAGIAFDYVPYEIGPYAMGETLLYIPIGDIESYLKPGIAGLLR